MREIRGGEQMIGNDRHLKASWRLGPVLMMGVVLVLTCAGQARGEDVLFKPGIFTSSEVCGKCHADIYKAWSGASVHAQSMADPDFQNALAEVAIDNRSTCLLCHAPTTIVTKDIQANLNITHEGITCDFCHSVRNVDLEDPVPFDLDVGVTKRGPIRNPGVPPHKAVHSELHTKSLFCASCHEFKNKHGVAVLSNYSEWLEGPYPGRQVECQGCHMEFYKGKLVAGQDSKELSRIFINLHHVPGGSSSTQLRRAFGVEIVDAKLVDGTAVVSVEVSNIAAGHKIPGGLSTHSARLEVTLDDGTAQSRVYERVLVDGSGQPIREVARQFAEARRVRSDNRLEPEETRKERFEFSATKPGTEVEARLIYVIAPPYKGAERREIDVVRDVREIR